jgi:hypothetical protein
MLGHRIRGNAHFSLGKTEGYGILRDMLFFLATKRTKTSATPSCIPTTTESTRMSTTSASGTGRNS